MGGFTKRKSSPLIALDGGVDEFHASAEIANNKLQGNGKTANIHIDGKQLMFRPGKTLFGLAFENIFNGVFEYVDDQGNARLEVACDGKVYETTASAKTLRDSGLTNEELHFQQFGKRLYYNGANTQRKITQTTAARIGVVAPEEKPTVAKAGTGLTGSYAWKFTFVIEEGGVKVWESNPSPVSDSLTCTNEGATITPGFSADTRVNARYIYRTAASGATYDYEGKISNNTEAATFTSGSVTDALLGDTVETTHGVPETGFVSEGCGNYMFWLVNSSSGSRLYYSEIATTEPYLEYQSSANWYDLIGGGLGRGLKRLLNPNSGKEDLYIFQDHQISMLPYGDANSAMVTIDNKNGCKQQDTIAKYKNELIFLNGNDAVCILKGNRVIDISSRAFPVSLKATRLKTMCRAAIIFDHYYAITVNSSLGKLYNHTTWVCDLRTISEVQDGFADAVWYPWEIDAEYLIQRADGTVLMLSNKDYRIYSLSLSKTTDQNSSGVEENFIAIFRTKDFGGEDQTIRKQPVQLHLVGAQEHQLSVTPYYGDYFDRHGTLITINRPGGGAVFIAGVSVMGSVITEQPIKMSTGLPSNMNGVYFGFAFSKSTPDFYFKLRGIQFTFYGFQEV